MARNARVGAAMLIVEATRIALDHGPDAKSTAARIQILPNLAGIIPDYAKVTIDFRAPQRATLDAMLAAFEAAKARPADEANVTTGIADHRSFGDAPFDRGSLAPL